MPGRTGTGNWRIRFGAELGRVEWSRPEPGEQLGCGRRATGCVLGAGARDRRVEPAGIRKETGGSLGALWLYKSRGLICRHRSS